MREAEPGAGRVIAWALTALVVVPALLFSVLLLVMFLPEALGYTCGADDPGCGRSPVNTAGWWTILGASLAAAAFLGLAWVRQWSADRWWPWPVAALGSVVVGYAALIVLSGG